MRKLYALILVVAVFGLFIPMTAHAAEPTNCQKEAALINYRSSLLTSYKKKENNRYEVFRNRWAGRIQYASQWLTQDAEKARDSLYAYDALHAKTNAELDKQITQFSVYEKDPVGCDASDKARYDTALAAAHGSKKSLTGNALIRQLKDKESEYQRKDFKKSSDELIKKLHKAKKKHPSPLYGSPINIKDV